MKNTLSITSDGTICSCNCVDSVADGTNSLYIALEVGNVTSPQLKIWLNDVLKSTTTLTANEINYINVSPELFTANGVITFQYLDDDYTGQVFTINFPSSLDGNLSVDKTSDYVFTAKYTTSGATYDAELSTTSENAVQNKVVTAAINITNNNLSSTTSTANTANKKASKALTEIPKYKIQTLKAIRAGANYIRIKSTNNTLPYLNPFGILVLSYEGIGFVNFTQAKAKQTPSSYNNVFNSGVVNSGIYALDTNRQFAILAPQGIEFEFY